jgi:hypothetical protein
MRIRADLFVLPTPPEPSENVVGIGSHHELANGQTHLLGVVASEDVSKVAGGNDVLQLNIPPRSFGKVPLEVEVREEVVDGLSEDASPVDRVDCSEFVLGVEFLVSEECLDNILSLGFSMRGRASSSSVSDLAVIEGCFDSDIVDVRVCHRRHLGFLDWRNTALGMENEDGHIGLATEAIDGSTGYHQLQAYACGAQSTHLPVSPLVAPTTVRLSGASPSDFCAFLLSKKNSKRFPSSWRATSLNAKVGPWNSSRI